MARQRMCSKPQSSDKPPALAHHGVLHHKQLHNTNRDSITTNEIALIAGVQRMLAMPTDPFRGQSPLDPRFDSHSWSTQTTRRRETIAATHGGTTDATSNQRTSLVVEQIKKTQAEPQWIVAQRLLSALTIPGFT